MKSYNFILFLLCLLVAFWAVLNNDFSLATLGAGFIIGTTILFVSHVFVVDSDLPDLSFHHIGVLVYFVFKTFLRIVPSSLQVIQAIYKDRAQVDRVMVDLPSQHKFVNALACNAITLTPGTITLEFNDHQAEILMINPQNRTIDDLRQDIEESFKELVDL